MGRLVRMYLVSGLGLVTGLVLGCKGPGGTQGLCDTLHACGDIADAGACVLDLSQCENAENDANYCLDLNGCDAYAGCFLEIQKLCGMAPGTSSDVTTDAPDDPTTTGPDDPTTTGAPDASTTNVDPDPATTTAPEPETTAPDPGTTTTAGDPVAECKAEVDPPTECHDCICDNCYDNYQACVNDEGCTAIRMCAEETGCMGLDCLESCGDVIDMYGGFLGMSAKIGLDLNECLGDFCMAPCTGN